MHCVYRHSSGYRTSSVFKFLALRDLINVTISLFTQPQSSKRNQITSFYIYIYYTSSLLCLYDIK